MLKRKCNRRAETLPSSMCSTLQSSSKSQKICKCWLGYLLWLKVNIYNISFNLCDLPACLLGQLWSCLHVLWRLWRPSLGAKRTSSFEDLGRANEHSLWSSGNQSLSHMCCVDCVGHLWLPGESLNCFMLCWKESKKINYLPNLIAVNTVINFRGRPILTR